MLRLATSNTFIGFVERQRGQAAGPIEGSDMFFQHSRPLSAPQNSRLHHLKPDSELLVDTCPFAVARFRRHGIVLSRTHQEGTHNLHRLLPGW